MTFPHWAESLKTHRQHRALTQDELGARAGLTSVYISRLERGKNAPSLEVAYQIATALDLSVTELFPWEATCQSRSSSASAVTSPVATKQSRGISSADK